MAKFIEDFLDDHLTDEQYLSIFQASEEAQVGDKPKVFRDVLMIIEVDRMLFKLVNSTVAKLILEDKAKMINLLYPFDDAGQPADNQAWCLLTFVRELLRF